VGVSGVTGRCAPASECLTTFAANLCSEEREFFGQCKTNVKPSFDRIQRGDDIAGFGTFCVVGIEKGVSDLSIRSDHIGCGEREFVARGIFAVEFLHAEKAGIERFDLRRELKDEAVLFGDLQIGIRKNREF
jgi:hypothetical protein